MRHSGTIISGLMLLALLSACAGHHMGKDTLHQTPARNKICPQLDDNIAVCLLDPANLPQGTARHVVSLQYADKDRTFIGILTINQGMLRLRGLSPMGLKLFDLQYNGHSIQLHAPDNALPKPALLIALLQLMLAEPALLKKTLPESLQLNTRAIENGVKRVLRAGNEKIIIITTHGDTALTANYAVAVPALNMKLKLQTLE